MKPIATGLGLDFDAAESRVVVDRRVRIVVNVNGADCRLRRDLSVAEAIDVNLRCGDTRAASSHREKLLTQRLRVIRQDFELIAGKANRILLVGTARPRVNADDLCSGIDGEAKVQTLGVAGVDGRVAPELAKARRMHGDCVFPSGERYGKTSGTVRERIAIQLVALDMDRSARDARTGRIVDGPREDGRRFGALCR